MAAGPAGVGDNLLPLGTSIWLTIGFMGSSLVIIIMSAYMVAHRKTPFVRRKSWPLFLASSAGIVSVYISQTVYCWVYWQAVRGSGAIWWTGQSLYYLGFVMCFFTMAIRSWRIVCIFSTTIDLVPGWPPCKREVRRPRSLRVNMPTSKPASRGSRAASRAAPQAPVATGTAPSQAPLRWNLLRCERVTPFVSRTRGNCWTFKRVTVLVLPAFFITMVLFPVGAGHFAEQLWTWYDLVALTGFMAVALRLYCIRGQVTLDDLVETRMLIMFSVFATVYFVVDNFMWFLVIRPLSVDDPHHVFKFWAFELFQIVNFNLLFACTTGYTCWHLWRHGGSIAGGVTTRHRMNSTSDSGTSGGATRGRSTTRTRSHSHSNSNTVSAAEASTNTVTENPAMGIKSSSVGVELSEQ